MIAVLSFFVPPLLLVLTRERLYQDHKSFYRNFITYIFAVLGLNWFIMLVLNYVFNSKGDLFSKLDTYNNFACKYILLAMALGGSEPYIESFLRSFIREKLELHLSEFKDFPVFHHWKLLAGVYAAFLFFLNFIRIFDNNFWADEAATLNAIKATFTDITVWAAGDVHPPLYYYMLKIMYMIFGDQGWAVHLLSLFPCLIIMILSLTVFWKKFGKGGSIILITFIGLSYNAVYYNMEVRMYSWAGLFVLLSFYELGEILDRQKRQDYILFTLFSLAAAYSHYFAMITVAFFYLVIMAMSVFPKRLSIKAVFVTWAGTFLGYLPWIVRFVKTIQRTAGDYWITSTPTFKAAIYYLFSSRFTGLIAWVVLCVAFILFFCYETNLLAIDVNEKKKLCISISFKRINFSNTAVLVFSGILSVLGTIIFAIVYSNVIRPVFALRYIYAASVVAWMTLAIVISKLKFGRLWVILLWVFLLAGFIPRYQTIYMNEKRANENLQTTLEATTEIGVGDIILTNIEGITRYYYPKSGSQLVSLDSIPQLDENVCYYLIVFREQDMTVAFEEVTRQGFIYTQIVDAGNLGTYTVYIYRIEK